MRPIKKSEYMTTLGQYYIDNDRTMEDIAACCNTTKPNISMAISEAEKGTRREVSVYVDKRSNAISFAFTCGPVFGFKG